MQGQITAFGFDVNEMIASFPPPPTFFETTWRAEPEQLAELQLNRLKTELKRTAANPFYARRWAEASFDPDSVTSLADLPRVPAYMVADIRESIAQHPPYGEHQNFLLDAPSASSARVYFSDGTTGKTRPTVNVGWDVELYGVITGRALWLAGLRPGDMVMNAWAYGTHAAAPFADDGARWNGCVQITASSGAVTPTVKQVELLRDYNVRSVLTFGTHLLNLAETAQSMGLDPKKDFSIKAFPGPSAGLAPKIEDAWGVTAYESYGFNEVSYMAIECPARDGLHIQEDAFIAEVVDIDTGEPLPEGELGKIVVTSLWRRGGSTIRFNSGDLSRLLPRQQCECGSWMRKMDYFQGRSDNMVKLRGTNVWPEAIGKVVADSSLSNGEYFVVVHGQDHREELTVHVESLGRADDFDAIGTELAIQLKTHLGVRINVEVVPVGALEPLTSGGAKKKRFDDRRPKSTAGRK
jgi:phenylacetate-CoA ligase